MKPSSRLLYGIIIGIRNVQYKKGYLCLESEGAEIHFRNLKIMELPPSITSTEQTAPLVK